MVGMSRKAFFVAAAAAMMAVSAAALRVQPPPGSAVILGASSDFDWRPPGHLPPGAEYHLVREDPKSHAIHAIVRFPAGYDVAEHVHSSDETIIVLRGKLWIRAGGLERTLKAGEFAVLPAGAPHELKSRTWWRKTWFVTITSGPYDHKYTKPAAK